MYHIVYKSTQSSTKQYYYGVHSTDNLNDGYQGSGCNILKLIKAGVKFETEVIEFCDTREEALILERKIVTREMLSDPLCLNIALGGGSTKIPFHSQDTKTKIGAGHRYKTVSECTKAKQSKAHKGKQLSVQHRTKLGRKGKTNYNFNGYWITPKGTFDSSDLAGIANNCNQTTVVRRCKSTNKQFNEWYFVTVPNTIMYITPHGVFTTTKEAAQHCGCSKVTILNRCKSDSFPEYKINRG